MGICSSSVSISVSTIKLVHQDGTLQEFSCPVRVSHVLQRYPGCFVCNADEMDFDNFVSEMHGDEELQLGQLYFLLPLSRLKYPLQAEEMAALAVKASSALRKNGVVVPLGGLGTTVSGGDGVVEKRRRRRTKCGGSSGGSGRNFTSMLSAIQE